MTVKSMIQQNMTYLILIKGIIIIIIKISYIFTKLANTHYFENLSLKPESVVVSLVADHFSVKMVTSFENIQNYAWSPSYSTH